MRRKAAFADDRAFHALTSFRTGNGSEGSVALLNVNKDQRQNRANDI